MFHNYKIRFLSSIALCIAILTIFAILDVAGQRQARLAQVHREVSTPAQPLYTDFKGISLGMLTEDVRAKLGEPTQKDDEQDFYLLSDKVTAQVCYNNSHKVTAISVDYLGGSGAPAPKEVISEPVEKKPDGSTYKLVRYEKKGFWVSYYSSPGNTMVTVTIQQFP
jgi:hypothetical protein